MRLVIYDKWTLILSATVCVHNTLAALAQHTPETPSSYTGSS